MKEKLLNITKKLMLTPTESSMKKVLNEFDEILQKMKLLDEIDVTNVEPMTTPINEVQEYLREDSYGNMIEKAKLLENAANHDENYVMIKKVVK